VATYEKSAYKKLFVAERSGKVPAESGHGVESAVRKIGLGQWWTLVRRNVLLKVRDRAQGIILMVQAPLLGLLLGCVFGSLKFSSTGGFQTLIRNATGMELLLVIAAIWFGCNNVARDIVGEWAIFQRERMVSLKLPSYLFAKLTVAAVLSLLQCVVMLEIVTLMCRLQGNFFETLGVLYVASLVGAAMGLCVSAWASTTEAAIAMLPLVLLPIIALGGGLTPVGSMSKPMPQIAMAVPSRWAFEAAMLIEAEGSHEDAISDSENPEKTRSVGDRTSTCDLADISFPAKDGFCDQVPPAAEDAKGRTPLPITFVVLGAMLVFWLGFALVLLRMRDIQ
jgi:ABC transport system ATP-binding/permease protein